MAAKAAKGDRIVCFGEIMLRLSAPAGEFLLQSPQFSARFGGAEANVAVSLAVFGQQASMVTILPDNPLGRAAVGELRRYGVDTRDTLFGEGRLGIYFVTPGGSVRPSEVLYDRKNSAFSLARADLIDWDRVFDGGGWLHLSGVTPALGETGAAAALRAVQAAGRHGVHVSFDGNYRAKLWSQWTGDAASILKSILGFAELAFLDDRDVALMLGTSFTEPDPFERRRRAATKAFAAFPKLKRMASTVRSNPDRGSVTLAACMFARDSEWQIPAISLDVVDRIGTGDAFSAGLLHGLLEGMDDRAALEFALAAAALKHGIAGDFNLSSVADVQDLVANGRRDVRR